MQRRVVMREGEIKLRILDTGENRRYRWTYAGEHAAGRRIPREESMIRVACWFRGEVQHIIGRVFRCF